MKRIISCDWGTSVLRIRLVDVTAMSVLAEVRSGNGIANTFELWKTTGPQVDRLSFYQTVLLGLIKKLEEQAHVSLDDVPVITSGMSSSGIGMVELPYVEIPFNINRPALHFKRIEGSGNFKHTVFIISGIRSHDDVIRGEETQLIGCFNETNKGEHVFIFPGTHSKHITVKNEVVTGFRTYMTGELFELLSNKSILSSSVEKGREISDETCKDSYEQGVRTAFNSNLLHNAFLVRTNELFKKLNKQQNYFFLSGLVIGAEICDLNVSNKQMNLVAGGELKELYTIALRCRVGNDLNLEVMDPDLALMKGQIRLMKQLKFF